MKRLIESPTSTTPARAAVIRCERMMWNMKTVPHPSVHRHFPYTRKVWYNPYYNRPASIGQCLFCDTVLN